MAAAFWTCAQDASNSAQRGKGVLPNYSRIFSLSGMSAAAAAAASRRLAQATQAASSSPALLGIQQPLLSPLFKYCVIKSTDGRPRRVLCDPAHVRRTERPGPHLYKPLRKARLWHQGCTEARTCVPLFFFPFPFLVVVVGGDCCLFSFSKIGRLVQDQGDGPKGVQLDPRRGQEVGPPRPWRRRLPLGTQVELHEGRLERRTVSNGKDDDEPHHPSLFFMALSK